MPELPEVTAYIRALEPRILGKVLEIVRIRTPSLLRTFDPRVSELGSRHLTEVRRVGKRIVFELDGEFFAVIHLMISGRLHWTEKGTPIPKKRGHTAFDFNSGTLLLTKGERPRGNRAHQTKKDAERLIGPRRLCRERNVVVTTCPNYRRSVWAWLAGR